MEEFLYRGLNENEIKAQRLIPKQQGVFAQHPRLPLTLPFNLGESPENAARNHQKGYATSGVSTTTSLKAAMRYATHYGTKNGVAAKISRQKLREHSIREFKVPKSGEIVHPEDCEVILYNEDGQPIPSEVIVEMIQVKADEISEWLDDVEKEILELFHHKQLFEFTRDEILEKNETVKNVDGTYFGWIMRSSTIDMIIRLARPCDDGRDRNSFVRFLRKLSGKDEYLSRGRFVALYTGSSVEDLADTDFDRLAGNGANSFPKDEIEKDIKILTRAEPFASIIQYRNEYVAHIGKERGRKPTYDELFSAMQQLTDIMKKYRLLLTGQNRLSDAPTIQGDWQAPLRAPLVGSDDENSGIR